MARTTSSASENLCYELLITRWAVGYSSHHKDGQEPDEYFNLDLDVSLKETVKDVRAGNLVLYGSKGIAGGSLNYDSEKRLHGCLWIGLHGAASLATLLINDYRPTLVLWGSKFRYREARIRDVSWFTEGHPELADVEIE